MTKAQTLNVIEKNRSQIWNQRTKVNLKQMPNNSSQQKFKIVPQCN